jgi:hypothetical protein
MTAFDRAWDLLKMPVYHGTTEDSWERIQEEGLKPTDHAPQLYDYTEEEIKEIMGISDEEFEHKFGGDWNFFYGDQAPPQSYWLGGKPGAITNAQQWSDDMDGGPVVLEIDDRHPDSPFFMPEPKMDGYAFNEAKDQRRSNKIVPPHLIRRVSPEEIEQASGKHEQYRTSLDNIHSWLEELQGGMREGKFGGMGDDREWESVLNLISRLNNYRRGHENPPFWGPNPKGGMWDR